MAKVEKPATTRIAPPVARKDSVKRTPATTSKPAPKNVKPMQFKIPASLHQEIKLYCVEQGLTMTELFLLMYNEHRAQHG